jgi:hypothetical protein
MQIILRAPKNPFVDLDAFIKRLERPGNAERRKVFDAITQGFQRNFSAEGSRRGKWRALAPSTVIDRQRRGYGGQHPILVRTGDLRASFVQRGAKDHVEEFQLTAQGWRILAGSASEIGFFQELGTQRIPPRPITELTGGAEQRIINTIDYMIATAEAATIAR